MKPPTPIMQSSLRAACPYLGVYPAFPSKNLDAAHRGVAACRHQGVLSCVAVGLLRLLEVVTAASAQAGRGAPAGMMVSSWH